MRVGDSLEILYSLPGPLPAGNYDVLVRGYTSTTDALLHATVLYRHAGATDVTLGEIDSKLQPTTPAELQVWVQGSISAPALAASVGDGLLLHLDYVSGSANFTVIETGLAIP